MRSTRAEGNFRFMNSRDKTRNLYVLGPKRTLGSWNSRDKTLETDVCVLLHLISCFSQEAGGGREPLASNLLFFAYATNRLSPFLLLPLIVCC
jgi:hypothetical protein